jgi:nucleotide-binding universal stress UspA family protein
MRETIIVGYEDKEPARRALDRALDEAKSRRATLVVVSVMDLPLDPTAPRNYGTLDDGPFARALDQPPELAGALAEARARVEEHGIQADYLWAAGEPAHVIVDLARDRGASLIVVGAHHDGFFSHLLTPGVDEQVQRDAGCDVLVVP